MKAISLWQPWASAIALGSKKIETRSWETSYRGPLLIHAAKRCVKDELIYHSSCWNWCAALNRRMGAEEPPLWEVLPFGAIVAICELIDCRPTGNFTNDELDTPRRREWSGVMDVWTERQMGDFSLGRFGWVLDHVRPLSKPMPYKGMQRLFDVPKTMLEQSDNTWTGKNP